jgi:hypothetical protein
MISNRFSSTHYKRGASDNGYDEDKCKHESDEASPIIRWYLGQAQCLANWSGENQSERRATENNSTRRALAGEKISMVNSLG